MKFSRRKAIPLISAAVLAATLFFFGCQTAPKQPSSSITPISTFPQQPAVSSPTTTATPPSSVQTPASPKILLGIDILESSNFRAIAGKRVALLTHPAGVNRNGTSTTDILRRAPNVRLVKLFAPEHSASGTVKAAETFEDYTDPKTGLTVHSLYGKNRKPTKQQLAGIDVLVIDLQDIGVRSYTYNVSMRYAIEACFENNVEVLVLDRPNPLGGLKIDGPTLDRNLRSGVGAYCIPYVHGLTLGELARMAVGEPDILEIPANIRKKGRLTVIPMAGWQRSMRWPETGLNFVPTSPLIRDANCTIAYAMLGLGCEYSGFRYGVRNTRPYFSITFNGTPPERITNDLRALRIPGLAFQTITTKSADGKSRTATYIDITDWSAWNPTELSFHLMLLACRYNPPNPYTKLTAEKIRLFNIHVGSNAWWSALSKTGASTNLPPFLQQWRQQSATYQSTSSKYHLYK